MKNTHTELIVVEHALQVNLVTIDYDYKTTTTRKTKINKSNISKKFAAF